MTLIRGMTIGTAVAEEPVEDDQDWAVRSTAVGVLKAFKFRTDVDLGEDWVASGGSASSLGHGYRDFNGTPAIDTSVYLPGSSASMRMTHPSGGNAGACGRWDTHFGGGLSCMFPMPGEANVLAIGEGEDLWYQYRIRWDSAMVNEVVPANVGVKLADIGDGSNKPQLVHQGWQASPLIISYDGNNPAITLWEVVGADQRLQGGTAPYCVYPDWEGAGCFSLQADEWVTITTHYEAGSIRAGSPWDGRYWDAHVKIWAKRYGQPAVLIIDYDSTLAPEQANDADPVRQGRFQIFNNDPQTEYNAFWKLWLSPYATDKTAAAHTPASAYYDELIISRSEIAQPTDLVGYPTWRQGLTANQLHAISGTEQMGGAFPGANSGANDLINGWGGLACAGNKLYTACSTGHGDDNPTSWYNPVGYIDLSADEPAWVLIDAGSDVSDVDSSTGADPGTGYYHDGRPCGRHIYYCNQYVQNALGEGIPRVFMFTAQAIHGSAPLNKPNIDAYRLDGWTGGPDGSAWEITATSPGSWVSMWDGHPDGASISTTCLFPGIAKHPYTEDVYINSDEKGGTGGDANTRAIVHWSSFTGELTKLPTSPVYPDTGKLLSGASYPMLLDAKRNRLVMIRSADEGWADGLGTRLEFISLTAVDGKLPVTKASITGDVPEPYNAGFIYNVDDDMYYVFAADSTSPYLRIWKINPDTAGSPATAVSELIFTSTTAAHGTQSANEALSRVHYHPNLKGFTWASEWSQPLYFFPTA
jgi:hypothetical protein